MLRSHMAKEYFIQYQEGKLPGFPKNLTDEQIAPRGASSCHHLPTCDDKTGSQPCAEALKVFGAFCDAVAVKPKRRKSSFRSDACVSLLWNDGLPAP
jgi:hypothetical protein